MWIVYINAGICPKHNGNALDALVKSELTLAMSGALRNFRLWFIETHKNIMCLVRI